MTWCVMLAYLMATSRVLSQSTDWFVKPDGSGAWVRRDRQCSRFRTLRGAGPQPAEITARHTLCSISRQPIAPPMLDYPSTKEIAAELPGECPRDVVTIFEFTRPSNKVSQSVITVQQDAPLVTAILAELFP